MELGQSVGLVVVDFLQFMEGGLLGIVGLLCVFLGGELLKKVGDGRVERRYLNVGQGSVFLEQEGLKLDENFVWMREGRERRWCF